MIEEIAKIIENRNQLAQQAHEQYEPLVNNIIASQNNDVNHICYTMDFMLDFCFDDEMLALYRRLCRYLLGIDPQAAADYVNYYREMWDEEGTHFGWEIKEENT
jgi:hypothetical protein